MVEATVALKYLLDLEFPCKKNVAYSKKRPGIFIITKKKNWAKIFLHNKNQFPGICFSFFKHISSWSNKKRLSL